jgi:hypothetical protein
LQGSRRWAPTPGVTPRRRQPATRLPGDYLDGTSTRWRRRACGHTRSDHRTHRPPIPSRVPSGHAIVDPPSHDRVDLIGEVLQRLATAQVQPPALDLATHLLSGLVAHRGNEPDKAFAGVVLRPAGPERVTEEGELLVLVRARAVRILAVPGGPGDRTPGLPQIRT